LYVIETGWELSARSIDHFRDRRLPLMTAELILASSSPQRQNLLREAGYPFVVVPPRPAAECGICSRETPPEYVARLAWQKAADVGLRLAHKQEARSKPGQPVDAIPPLIVACDTVAECAGRILGKPVNRAHAETMLRLLSGREHHVYSGLCLWPAEGEPLVRVACTTLRMDSLADGQIQEYLESGLWEGKSGAFGYQDRIDWLHIVSGSESNVIGLPMELLAEMLGELSSTADRAPKGR
jgi:septum formation protein